MGAVEMRRSSVDEVWMLSVLCGRRLVVAGGFYRAGSGAAGLGWKGGTRRGIEELAGRLPG